MKPMNLNESELIARSAMMGLNAVAHGKVVNRTHRVVRQRAQTMRANQLKSRSLVLPMIVCSTVMIVLFYAFWRLLEQYESLSQEAAQVVIPPSASGHHLFFILLWFLPASIALLAMVWFRRTRNQSDPEASR